MSKIGVPPESEACVVEGLAVVYGVIHPCQTLYVPNITLPKQWDSIPTGPWTTTLLLRGMVRSVLV